MIRSPPRPARERNRLLKIAGKRNAPRLSAILRKAERSGSRTASFVLRERLLRDESASHLSSEPHAGKLATSAGNRSRSAMDRFDRQPQPVAHKSMSR